MGQTKGQDQFESDYMSDEASVRHRDKRVSRAMAGLFGAVALFNLVLTLFVGLTNATASKPLPEAALPFVLAAMVAFSGLFALIGLAFAVLRTVVTDREVIVKYGLWGPRIPLESITDCQVAEYEWTQFGGWGIRRGAGGVWAYVPGPGPVVEIRYRDDGEDKCVQVGAQDAAALAAQIQRARRAAAGVRIDASPDEAHEDEAARAEVEAEAAQELGGAERSERAP